MVQKAKKAVVDRWRAVTSGWDRVLLARAPWVLLFLLGGTWALAPEGLLVSALPIPGQIAPRDYLADREVLVLDEETTQSKRDRAAEAILPVYDFDDGRALSLDDRLARFFVAGRDVLRTRRDSESELDVIAELDEASGLRFTPAQVALLRERDFAPELEDRMRTLVTSVLSIGVIANKPLLLENRLRGVTVRSLLTGEEQVQLDLYAYRGFPDEVRELFAAEVGAWSGWRNRTERALLIDLLVDNSQPNVALNLSETQSRREAARAAVEPVYTQVRPGQVVARKGDTLTASAVRVLNALHGGGPTSALWLATAGNALLVLLALGALGFGLGRSRLAGVPRDVRAFGGTTILLITALLAVKFGWMLGEALHESMRSPAAMSERSYAYALPYAALALTASLLYGRSLALLSSVVFAVLVGRMAGDDASWATMYVLAGSLAAIYSLDRLKQRVALARSGLLVGAVSMICVVMFATLGDAAARTPGGVLFALLCALVGGVLVAAATSFLLPILESLLHVTTDIKLLELSDTNLPLLRRLAFEAPGTFQHSLMVANLAKTGCEAIGANPVLAYTSGLYHDVGKMIRARYFVENQRGDENPHDKLAPSISSMIVINHVKDGLELAREYRLPQPILDAIAQHHGTRRLSFFYNRALELAERDGAPDEQRYRYPGPKPQSKEMGVLMLADAVEAASRTLVAPTADQLQGLIRRLIGDSVEERQFDECELTFADLDKVSEAFFRVLETIHHRRVDYPGYEFQVRGRRLRMVGGAP